MARVAVIGGGIAGATVALLRAQAGDVVTLFEAEPQLGGQLSTVREGGFIVEQGAEGYVAGSDAVAKLATELGLAESVIGQLTNKSYAFDGRALHELRRGEAAQFLGFQVPQRALGQGIRAFQRGMAELTEVIARELRTIAHVRVSSSVKGLTRGPSEFELTAGSTTFAADRVVIATDARSASALLAPTFGSPASALASSRTASSVTVSLAYRRASIEHPLDGTGFVVAEGAQTDGFRACTFTTSKLAARAPDGFALLRAFFRPNDADLATLDDAAWAQRAARNIAAVLAPRAAPEHTWVARWPSALPVFDAEQHARVLAVEAALSGSGVALAGSAFHGAGIDAALVSARRVAEHSV